MLVKHNNHTNQRNKTNNNKSIKQTNSNYKTTTTMNDIDRSSSNTNIDSIKRQLFTSIQNNNNKIPKQLSSDTTRSKLSRSIVSNSKMTTKDDTVIQYPRVSKRAMNAVLSTNQQTSEQLLSQTMSFVVSKSVKQQHKAPVRRRTRSTIVSNNSSITNHNYTQRHVMLLGQATIDSIQQLLKCRYNRCPTPNG